MTHMFLLSCLPEPDCPPPRHLMSRRHYFKYPFLRRKGLFYPGCPAGRFAESEYFGNPGGLMDQLACAAGGFAAMDFATRRSTGSAAALLPSASRPMPVFGPYWRQPCGSHRTVCGNSGRNEGGSRLLWPAGPGGRCRRTHSGQKPGSCAARCRIGHFCAPPTFSKKTGALPQCPTRWQQNDIPQILALFSASGRSSQRLLQNAWPDAKPEERGISLALLLSSHLLQNKGACRIHGGGFAGQYPGPWRRRNWPLLISGKWKRHSDQTPAAGCTSVLPARGKFCCSK